MVKLTRKENNTNTKKRSFLELLSAPGKYSKRKVKRTYKRLMNKETKKTDMT